MFVEFTRQMRGEGVVAYGGFVRERTIQPSKRRQVDGSFMPGSFTFWSVAAHERRPMLDSDGAAEFFERGR